MRYGWKGRLVRVFVLLLILPLMVLPISAEEKETAEPPKDKWRILLGAFAGQFDLQLQTKLPFNYVNPSSGQREIPSLGRASGLTQNGAMDLGVEGIGPQKGLQFMILSDSLVFQATYARVDVNFAPLRNPPVGVNTAEGNAGGNVYSTNLDYYMNISRYVQPMVGIGYAAFGAYYKARNVVGTTVGNGLYESFPTIDADDGYSSDVGKAGLRIKLPIQSWYITPYFQYAGNEYHINVRTTAGTVQNNVNGYPADPNGILDAWYYQGVGSVSTVDSMTQVSRQARSAGIVFFMDYKKFISLTINARRNFTQAAWNVSATLMVFLHPNMGIMANYAYSEPEILFSFNRSWAIGPVFTTTF
ncbi:hypothetical protein EHO58_05015 [Leptospira selangorensis]|uniref:hypothetical protein n=1 Tax=Leptospira selangorensis TaxID=2484982 RepID=UPI001082EE17|nr:hypothetical protein [Leptospira selangorensis]TGK09738.1 hypothetical protein EHO58_05015 [Leptospira selangorensis]